MTTVEDARVAVKNRHFTVVSAVYYVPDPTGESKRIIDGVPHTHEIEKLLVLCPFKAEAEALARGALKTVRPDEPADVHLYPRNYIDDARSLVASGRVAELMLGV